MSLVCEYVDKNDAKGTKNTLIYLVEIGTFCQNRKNNINLKENVYKNSE